MTACLQTMSLPCTVSTAYYAGPFRPKILLAGKTCSAEAPEVLKRRSASLRPLRNEESKSPDLVSKGAFRGDNKGSSAHYLGDSQEGFSREQLASSSISTAEHVPWTLTGKLFPQRFERQSGVHQVKSW